MNINFTGVLNSYKQLEDFKVVRKTADQTIDTSETFVNITNLVQAVGANEVWVLTFFLLFNSGTTPDIKWNLTVPSGGNAEGYMNDYKNAIATVREASAISWPCDGDNTLAVMDVVIKNSSTAGNVQLQFAQDTSTASNTKVLEDSCIKAIRLA